MLSNKNRQRLKQLSTVIFSTEEVMDNMNDIQKEYVQELQQAIDMCTGKTLVEVSSSTTLAKIYDFELPNFNTTEKEPEPSQNQKNNNSDSDSNGQQPSAPIATGEPSWAKKLYRKIMVKCHPDKLSFDVLSAQEIGRRQIYLEKARKTMETGNWQELLYIGIRLDEYIEDISGKEQINMLNQHYSDITNNIDKVQRTMAWTWGSQWENIDRRLKILESVLLLNNIPFPPKHRMLEILVELEEM